MGALIRYAQPVKGKREFMCKTDEATVKRIRAPGTRYDGMVERLQFVEKMPVTMGQLFRLSIPAIDRVEREGYTHVIGEHQVLYHINKFLALRAAHSFFPDNFVDVQELHFCRDANGKLYSATYSRYVRDETGAIKRRKENMRRFYSEMSEERLAIQIEADEKEHELNPELRELVAKAEGMGFRIAHPEANYHISQNTTVFFEIQDLDILKASKNAVSCGDRRAVEALSVIYANYVYRLLKPFFQKSMKQITRKIPYSDIQAVVSSCRMIPPIKDTRERREAAIKENAKMCLRDIYRLISSFLAYNRCIPLLVPEHRSQESEEFFVGMIEEWKKTADEFEQTKQSKSSHMELTTTLPDIIDPRVIEMLEQEILNG